MCVDCNCPASAHVYVLALTFCPWFCSSRYQSIPLGSGSILRLCPRASHAIRSSIPRNIQHHHDFVARASSTTQLPVVWFLFLPRFLSLPPTLCCITIQTSKRCKRRRSNSMDGQTLVLKSIRHQKQRYVARTKPQIWFSPVHRFCCSTVCKVGCLLRSADDNWFTVQKEGRRI